MGSAAATRDLRAADPAMAAIIDRVGPIKPGRDPSRPAPHDHYGALVRAIVGQQLSSRAARAIYAKLLERFGGRPPTPEEILAADPDELRAAAGLSRAKVGYLRSLAEHVVSGDLDLDELRGLPDAEVIARLVAVKGLGPWSADMFLMFQLERPDVIAVGDLGLRKAIMLADGLPAMPTPAEVAERAEVWRPHRTTASLYLWRSLANTPV